jgi:CHAD domain-containing protein
MADMLNDETVIQRSRNLLYDQWDDMRRLRRAVLTTWALEDIHDLRVASRRFRTALNLFEPFTPEGQTTALQKHVRKLTRALGRLRNIDEAKAFFLTPLTSRNGTNATSPRAVAAGLTDMRKGEVAKVHKVLKAFKPKKLDPLVREMVAVLIGDTSANLRTVTFSAYLSDTSLGLLQLIHDHLATAMVPDNRETRHALRIAIKKWRYFLEIVARILDRNHDSVLAHLKEYQSLLGRMNDMVEFSALCRNLKLKPAEHQTVEEALRHENELLWERFLELVETQPLGKLRV